VGRRSAYGRGGDCRIAERINWRRPMRGSRSGRLQCSDCWRG
jgi:hypothetical protein